MDTVNEQLINASRSGNLDIVKELITHGADVNCTDSDGDTPLIYASENGHLEIVKELIKHGADVNHVGKYDGTPIVTASKNRQHEIVEELIKHGVYNRTALILASVFGYYEIAKELIISGADINRVNKYGDTTLLTLAILYGHNDIAKELILYTKSIPVDLLSKITDIDFHKFIILNNIEISNNLLETARIQLKEEQKVIQLKVCPDIANKIQKMMY